MNGNGKHRHWPIVLTGMALATAIGIAAVATFLAVKGEEESQYQFIGVSRYNLLTTGGSPYVGCGGAFSDAELVTWFDELDAQNVNAVRFWAFQSFTPNFTRMDRVLQLAGARGIKVMPVLENNWGNCTQGGVKLDTWYAAGYKAPYGSYTLSLPDHITNVVSRYKDDPRILAWQVMNEAGIVTSSGSCGSFTTFKAFAADTTGLVKSIDPDTPVSFGTLGSGQCGARGAEYQSLHDVASIDYCEYHDYWEPATAMPDDGHNRLRQRIDQCAALGKPLFVGEAGIQCSDDACRATRAGQIDAKMAAARDAGVVGYLIWAYRDRTGCCTSWEYGQGDPLADVVASYGSPATPTPTSPPTLTPTATPALTATPTSTPASGPLVPCSDNRGCPDLIMDNVNLGGWEAFISPETWAATDCAVQEGLVEPGERTLLRFHTAILNQGPGALHLLDPATHPEYYTYDPCHDHYHFNDMVAYRLWTQAGYKKWQRLRAQNPNVDSETLLLQNPSIAAAKLRVGQKRGWCNEETYYLPDYDYAYVDPVYGESYYHVCASLGGEPANPGINPRAGDGYHYRLDGQWLDVTGLRAGRYILEQEVNPRRIIEEVDYLDNSTGETIVIPR